MNVAEDSLVKSLIEVLEKRQNTFSQQVDGTSVRNIFASTIKPVLELGVMPPLNSADERRKFITELFALACYAKYNIVKSWIYEPLIDGGKTPDFLINGSLYVEIYSPTNDLPRFMLEEMKEAKSSNASVSGTGFHPVSAFNHAVAIKTLTEKSKKYDTYEMIFIVHTTAGGFPSDMINSLNRVKLHPEHKIVYYHGDKLKFTR